MQKNGQNKLGSFFILPLFLIHFGASLARGDPSKFTHSNRTLESLLCPRGKRHSNPAAEITVSAEKKNQTRQLLVIHKRGGRQPEVLLPKVNSIQSIPCQFLNCIHFENILATLLSHNPPMPEKNSKARNSRDFFGRVQSPKPKMMNAWIMLNHMMQMNMSPEIRITTVLPGIWGTCIIFNEWIARHKKLV